MYVTLRGEGGGVRLISYSTQTRSGTPFLIHSFYSLMIGNILTMFEKNLTSGFFFKGMTLNHDYHMFSGVKVRSSIEADSKTLS